MDYNEDERRRWGGPSPWAGKDSRMPAQLREEEEEPLENPAIEVVMAHLYDLDKEELRRVAWEALLVSDGPDRQFANDHEQAGQVSQFEVYEPPDQAGFVILGKRGWTT